MDTRNGNTMPGEASNSVAEGADGVKREGFGDASEAPAAPSHASQNGPNLIATAKAMKIRQMRTVTACRGRVQRNHFG